MGVPPRVSTLLSVARQDQRRRLLVLGSLFLLDGVALMVAFALAYVVRFRTNVLPFERVPETQEFYALAGAGSAAICLALFATNHLYDVRRLFAGSREFLKVVNATTVALVLAVLINFLHAGYPVARGWLLTAWVLAILFVITGRLVARLLVRSLRRRGLLLTSTVIVGANEEGVALARGILSDPGSGARIVGFLDASRPRGSPVVDGLEVLGDLWCLDDLLTRGSVRQVIVASTAVSREELLDLYWNYGHDRSVDLHLSSGLVEILTTGVEVQEISRVPLVSPQRLRITGPEAVLKTTLDYTIAAAALVILAPVLLIIAVAIRLDSPGPVLHRRRVLGVSGRPFDAFKFRTMIADADQRLVDWPELRYAFEHGYKLKRDPRVTPIGSFLRRTSLDELPQLVNVLRGEMSLVGPRMIAPEESARYGRWQRNLVTVKPGITGPWQVQGRSDLPYEQRVELSMEYIRNYTLWLDVWILVRTFLVVLKGKGAY